MLCDRNNTKTLLSKILLCFCTQNWHSAKYESVEKKKTDIEEMDVLKKWNLHFDNILRLISFG